MSLRRSTSIPAELWPRYKFFSDPETQSRLDADPKRLATIQKDPNTVKWERPSSLVVDASWDKYLSFLSALSRSASAQSVVLPYLVMDISSFILVVEKTTTFLS